MSVSQEMFGIDIGALVAGGLEAAGDVHEGVLYKETTQEDPGNPTKVTRTRTPHPFKGFISYENIYRGMRDGKSLKTDKNPALSILGSTIDVVPELNDKAEIHGVTYTLVEIREVDPTQALFVFKVSD